MQKLHRVKGRLAGFLLALSVALTPAVGFAPSALASAPVRDISLNLESPNEVTSGDQVTLAVAAPAALQGGRYKVMRRVGSGEWVAVSEGRIPAGGSFSVTSVATGVGTNQWQVKASKSGVRHVSRKVRATVFAWYYLGDQSAVDEDGWTGIDTATVGGTTFKKSVEFYYVDAGEWVDYNLSYRCKTLEMWTGLDDASETGSSAGFSVSLDGAETGLGTQGLGAATKHVIDTTSRLRVRLEISTVTGDDVYPVFASPRVLCSGKP